VVQERQPLYVPNFEALPANPSTQNLAEKGIVAYYGVPLMAQGQLIGVLELYHRQPLTLRAEWVGLLETLAGQVAIAIDHRRLLAQLQQANIELCNAYDATIEGWARALDLRDKETEGHSRRVTELTVRLAQAMGMGEDTLMHIRRGALLHDIGKMGVPDQVLHKPGALSDDEWTLMRKHPAYAYDLLQPIHYLQPALAIPYCHHEKWDGTGYPQGLKGEAIPLAARIFAIVDVWDALTSDRPYRAAWDRERALAYISDQAGRHFDPAVVRTFVALIRSA
jgi:HD-GYP domain-containing protein (c-di-GMP phosphodiesterase class II)